MKTKIQPALRGFLLYSSRQGQVALWRMPKRTIVPFHRHPGIVTVIRPLLGSALLGKIENNDLRVLHWKPVLFPARFTIDNFTWHMAETSDSAFWFLTHSFPAAGSSFLPHDSPHINFLLYGGPNLPPVDGGTAGAADPAPSGKGASPTP